ncbi:hypothetical protein COV23_00715 [Candidatus Wolfebacteria bacterium CG10_big_fil_rev_8_21_14_0_10_31_9]|uniref:Phospholipid/glycerol acyltransferase domain-containing protein n=1 Tax=Candidatus Wolfebacteria bacterium CG10_big_fil_rev_8_21_14_0_10_31_9 TaxID=1975070 RepID=A0A2H0RCJ5_9BACT|nr:MAG: hypothetical protein COV23_00715 [Candidatus Wolfebacteria bacterium CG10_big_fil_rev_8_21_14_0_10_31_9]
MIVWLLHFLTWPISFLIFKFFNRFNVVGKENIKGLKNPVIFLSNHESYYDPFLLETGLSWFSSLYPVYYLANLRNFKKKTSIFFSRLYGAFSGGIEYGPDESIKIPLEILKSGKNLGIFPEWCYKTEIELERLEKLIVILAIKTGRPIVPVFIYGIFDGGISWKKILSKKREIKVVYGKPFILKDIKDIDRGVEIIRKALLETKFSLIEYFHEQERKFWNNYAKFYHYLERSNSYKDLINDFSDELPDKISGKWVDLGSGSGAITELLNKKNDFKNTQITATDFDSVMLNYLTKRFSNNNNINIKNVDIAHSLDFADNYLDGVTANLVLPYVIHHEGEIGKKAFKKLLKEIFRTIKPGGYFIWSSPKNNVNFLWVFIASWRNILDYKNLNHAYYGPAILGQALKIQYKGKRDIYHFLNTKNLYNILSEIGFREIKLKRSMAGQVNIISCKKL